MREYLFVVGCILGFISVRGFTAEENPVAVTAAPAATVTMKSLSFEPKKLEIRAGDSVIWTNGSHTRHTATSSDEGKTFDTGEIEPGESSKPVKFNKEGEFKYHCTVHGKAMSGSIVVLALEKK